nr:zinc-binding alcohol dehydrogenase [Propionibacterium sp.]
MTPARHERPTGGPAERRARAYWCLGPGRGELRAAEVPLLGPGECLVRTLVSGISAGTERLVTSGRVPDAVADEMRAPFQEGDFPFPVKYGYLAVGRVLEGPDALRGRRVFVLHPHQDLFVVPADAVTPVPDAVPTDRALLTGAAETALNGLWDGGPLVGDRVAVMGAGLIGATTALLLSRLPLERLTVFEPDAARRARVRAAGVAAAAEPEPGASFDLVFDCAAHEDALNTALGVLDIEGTLVELSWHGDRRPRVDLGSFFHSHRLRIVSSQVGMVSPSRRVRRTPADRRRLALELLTDPRFDGFVERSSAFDDLPATMAALARGEDLGLCHVVRYPAEKENAPCTD